MLFPEYEYIRIFVRLICCIRIYWDIHSVHNVACKYIRILISVHFMIFTHHWSPQTQHSLHSTPNNAVCTQHTARFTQHTLLYTQHTAHSTLYTIHCTYHIVHNTLYTAHSTQQSLYSTLYKTHCTQHTVHITLYTAHCTRHTVNSTLYTHHTLHSTIYTTHVREAFQPNYQQGIHFWWISVLSPPPPFSTLTK